VIRDGVLVTLGPVEAAGAAVRVGASRWRSGLDGNWATYVLERRDGDWVVTGTTGGVASS
jgi:hypothetical protein